MMYEESEHTKVLDSNTFKKPVKNIKVPKPATVKLGRPVSEAVQLMQERHFGCLLVLKDGVVAGILTERDLLMKVIGKGKDLKSMKVEEVMTPDPETFQPDDSIAFVLNAMHVGGYRHIPIVDEEKHPLAVVSVKDVVGFIAEHFPEELLNLPPKPMRETQEREGA